MFHILYVLYSLFSWFIVQLEQSLTLKLVSTPPPTTTHHKLLVHLQATFSVCKLNLTKHEKIWKVTIPFHDSHMHILLSIIIYPQFSSSLVICSLFIMHYIQIFVSKIVYQLSYPRTLFINPLSPVSFPNSFNIICCSIDLFLAVID